MKCSEFVSMLNKIIEREGDLNIYYYHDEEGNIKPDLRISDNIEDWFVSEERPNFAEHRGELRVEIIDFYGHSQYDYGGGTE